VPNLKNLGKKIIRNKKKKFMENKDQLSGVNESFIRFQVSEWKLLPGPKWISSFRIEGLIPPYFKQILSIIILSLVNCEGKMK
jgi:hypothetical protein